MLPCPCSLFQGNRCYASCQGQQADRAEVQHADVLVHRTGCKRHQGIPYASRRQGTDAVRLDCRQHYCRQPGGRILTNQVFSKFILPHPAVECPETHSAISAEMALISKKTASRVPGDRFCQLVFLLVEEIYLY